MRCCKRLSSLRSYCRTVPLSGSLSLPSKLHRTNDAAATLLAILCARCRASPAAQSLPQWALPAWARAARSQLHLGSLSLVLSHCPAGLPSPGPARAHGTGADGSAASSGMILLHIGAWAWAGRGQRRPQRAGKGRQGLLQPT